MKELKERIEQEIQNSLDSFCVQDEDDLDSWATHLYPDLTELLDELQSSDERDEMDEFIERVVGELCEEVLEQLEEEED